MKTCGECNLCCKVMGVASVTEVRDGSPFVIFKEKPQGEWCQYVKSGDGCGVYRTRPNACRDFSCTWLDSIALTAEYRPDKIGVVFVEPINYPELHIIHAHVDEADIDFYKNDDHPALPLLKTYILTSHVCVVAGTRRRILTNDVQDLTARLRAYKHVDPKKHQEALLLLQGA